MTPLLRGSHGVPVLHTVRNPEAGGLGAGRAVDLLPLALRRSLRAARGGRRVLRFFDERLDGRHGDAPRAPKPVSTEAPVAQETPHRLNIEFQALGDVFGGHEVFDHTWRYSTNLLRVHIGKIAFQRPATQGLHSESNWGILNVQQHSDSRSNGL